MDWRPFTTVGLLVREMSRNERSINFVGLTNTLLTDSDVLHLAHAMETSATGPRQPQTEACFAAASPDYQFWQP